MLSEWMTRARFFVKGKRRTEVDEELAFHLERQVEANLAAGMTAEEARRRAAIAFGGRERAREQCRAERPSWRLELLGRDLGFAVRGLWRNAGLTLVAVLTLALATGATSTIFSLLSQALLATLPVRDPQELVVLSAGGAHPGHMHSEGGDTNGHVHAFSYPMFRDLRARNGVLEGLIAEAEATVGVQWHERAEAVSAEMVSGNYFEVLGVMPQSGRLLAASDETAPGANRVAVVSFEYWKTHLGGAPVVGETLLINGTPFTVVGVAAKGFRSMVWGHTPAVYVPMTEQKVVLPEWDYLEGRNDYWLSVVGRLRGDVRAEKASAALNPLYRAIRAEEFKGLRDHSAKTWASFVDRAHLNLEAGATGFSPLRDDVRTPLLIVMGMVGLVTLMALLNVASLLLVRAASRVREFSVRYALGATGAQILRQLLCEGLLLGLLGAAAGLALVPEAEHVLVNWMNAGSEDPSAFVASVDWRVLVFTLAVSVAGSVLFSLAPAAQFWNPRLAEALRQQAGSGAGHRLKFRRSCVVLQVGFSLLLLVGAGMFTRTIGNLRHADAGFATDHLLAFELSPELSGYRGAAVVEVEGRVLERMAQLPGVRAVGATNDEDLTASGRGGDVEVSGYTPKPDEEFDIELPWVSDGYLQTLGVPLLAGRLFARTDTATSQKVAIVNRSFARHYFASPQAALGRHVQRPDRPNTDAVIVGVVEDVKHASMREAGGPICYTLFVQAEKPGSLMVYTRTGMEPKLAAGSIRAALKEIDARLIVNKVTTMTEEIDKSLMAERTVALLAGAFGVVAVLLAGIGLYGVLAYATTQRTREIGIRMALGARRTTVMGLILRETLVLAGWAVGGALPVAMLALRAVRSQLYGVSIADPAVYGLGVLGIVVMAVVAAAVPARRAAAVEPSRALRAD
ncbi:ABC transporter permease [Acidobacteria bacterium AB60]|nr:ABC transporter permease [Acidobacteria bacterium AB60]